MEMNIRSLSAFAIAAAHVGEYTDLEEIQLLDSFVAATTVPSWAFSFLLLERFNYGCGHVDMQSRT